MKSIILNGNRREVFICGDFLCYDTKLAENQEFASDVKSICEKASFNSRDILPAQLGGNSEDRQGRSSKVTLGAI